MKVPVEVLALAAACGESGPGRWNVAQVRFGRDESGPYAAATDTRILAVARWAADEIPDGQVGESFGADPAAVELIRRMARRDEGIRAVTVVSAGDGKVRLGVSGEAGGKTFTAAAECDAPAGEFPPVGKLVRDWEGVPEGTLAPAAIAPVHFLRLCKLLHRFGCGEMWDGQTLFTAMGDKLRFTVSDQFHPQALRLTVYGMPMTTPDGKAPKAVPLATAAA